MRRFDKRSLPALALMAAIVCTSGFVLAQSSPVTSSDSAQQPAPADSASKPAAPAATTTIFAQDSTYLRTAGRRAHGSSTVSGSHRSLQESADRTMPAVWNKMGIAYQLMFNLTDAMHCYRTSDKLDPKNSTVH